MIKHNSIGDEGAGMSIDTKHLRTSPLQRQSNHFLAKITRDPELMRDALEQNSLGAFEVEERLEEAHCGWVHLAAPF